MRSRRFGTLLAIWITLVAGILTPAGAASAQVATYNFVPLPVGAVAPSNGQITPTSRMLQVQMNTADVGWTQGLALQFATGAYGLRLLNTATGSIVWFIPRTKSYSTGSLTVSHAISFSSTSSVVTANPGTLSVGTRYSAILATGAALVALIGQDLGITSPVPTPLCCAYPTQTTEPWSFTTAATDAVATSGTSTSPTGTATSSSTGAGTSSLSASAVGMGTVTTAAYLSPPTSTPTSFTPSGAYFDVYVTLGNTFQSLTLSFCKAGAKLFWFNGSTWQLASSQVWKSGCLQSTITGTTSPDLSQMTGTTFALALPTVTAISPTSGAPSGGTTVTISGSGFTDSSGAPSVQSIAFGASVVPTLPGQSSPAFTVLSDTSIQVWSTPPGSGSVDVTVSTFGGISSISTADRFTYAASISHQGIAVPSYFYPTPGGDWSRIDAAAPAAGLAVINPHNGPGACDSAYATQVRNSQAHGIAVIGYVYTEYANTQLDYLQNPAGAFDRTPAAVKREIDTYYSCYPTLDGIFFDQGSTSCSDATTYYTPLSAYVKTKGGQAITVINPGNQSSECFMGAADILVTFEGSYADYLTYMPASWTRNYPNSRFWHLIYGTPDIVSMRNAVSLSAQRGAGWTYATGLGLPNPWGALPADPYWADELLTVRPAAPVVTSVTPNNGPLSGGTPLTINGTHLTSATQVCVGTACLASGAFTVNPAGTSITATAPSGSGGAVDITVSSARGTSAATSRDRFTYADPPYTTRPLVNGDFSNGVNGWTPNCKDWSGQGYTEGANCGVFYSTSALGLQLKPAVHPYLGFYQTVPATVDSTLTGTVTVNSMNECADGSVDVSVTLLDANKNVLGATLNNDPMFGNIVFGHHPYYSAPCAPYISASSPTASYTDMPTWTDTHGTQQFTMDIKSIVSSLPGIAASQVAYIKVQLTDYADASYPTVTFGNLRLTTTTPPGTYINVRDAGAMGDGVSNDTPAFANALSSLQTAGGGTLYVPPGVYRVQPSSLVVHSNTKVMGLGATLKPAASGYVLLELQGTNITVSNLSMDGADAVTRGMNVLESSSNVVLSHDVVDNIRQSSDPSNASLYYGAPVGVQVYGNLDTVLIEGTTVDNVVADRPECATCLHRVARGIRISPTATQSIATNVTIQNSAVSNVGPKDDGDCIVVQDSNSAASLTISRNTLTYCHKRAIKIQVPGVTVSNNTIDNPFLGSNYTDPQYEYARSAFGFDMYAAISVYNSNVTVTGNSVSGVGSFYNGIDVGNCTSLNTITVSNNSVHMGPESYTLGGSLVRLSGPLDTVTVTGNTLDTGWAGILQVPAGTITSATISGNVISNVTYPSLGSAGPC